MGRRTVSVVVVLVCLGCSIAAFAQSTDSFAQSTDFFVQPTTPTPTTALRARVFQVRPFVARVDGEPVVDEDWLNAQIAEANRVFEPAGIQFRLGDVVPIGEQHARLERRRDRHALGQFMGTGVIHWFVVGFLRDVDDPTVTRRGVHWRPKGYSKKGEPRKHFVVVAKYARPHVLAHELGHFFGNRTHPEIEGNIMSYLPSDAPRSFNLAQLQRIRFFAQRFANTGELAVGNME